MTQKETNINIEKINRVNLGCGSKLFPLKEGWTNVDIVSPPEVVLDFVAEVSEFPYSDKELNEKTQSVFLRSDLRNLKNIKSGSVHEVHAYHVLEHFYPQEVPQVLNEIKRILDPNIGCVVIECPDVIKCAKNFLQVETLKDPNTWFTLGFAGIYGISDPSQPFMLHKWGWYPDSMTEQLMRAGFRYVSRQPALTHKKEDRDFRVVAFVNQVPKDFIQPKVGGAAGSEINRQNLTGLGLVNKSTGRNEPLLVQPRDSVPETSLLTHIQTNIGMFNKWLQRTKVHGGKAFIVSAGPSLEGYIPKLKAEYNKERGDVIFCVKHSLPVLLEHGITPDYCVVLDPRPLEGISTHGKFRKDLFKVIPKETKFLVASMTNTEVSKYLVERGANIIGWHALASGIDRFLHTGIKLLIAGGTSAGMRTINIAYNMGFRDVVMVAFDNSMPKDWTPSEVDLKAVDADGRGKWIETYYKDPNNKFYSTGELTAANQDLVATFQTPADIVFDMWAGGIGGEIWKDFKDRFDIPEYSSDTVVEKKGMV